jgi:hypothetical protein
MLSSFTRYLLFSASIVFFGFLSHSFILPELTLFFTVPAVLIVIVLDSDYGKSKKSMVSLVFYYSLLVIIIISLLYLLYLTFFYSINMPNNLLTLKEYVIVLIFLWIFEMLKFYGSSIAAGHSAAYEQTENGRLSYLPAKPIKNFNMGVTTLTSMTFCLLILRIFSVDELDLVKFYFFTLFWFSNTNIVVVSKTTRLALAANGQRTPSFDWTSMMKYSFLGAVLSFSGLVLAFSLLFKYRFASYNTFFGSMVIILVSILGTILAKTTWTYVTEAQEAHNAAVVATVVPENKEASAKKSEYDEDSSKTPKAEGASAVSYSVIMV